MFRIEAEKTLAEPFAEEAKYFTEVRLLQRDVKIVLEGASNQNLLGTVLHPVSSTEFCLSVLYILCCSKNNWGWTEMQCTVTVSRCMLTASTVSDSTNILFRYSRRTGIFGLWCQPVEPPSSWHYLCTITLSLWAASQHFAVLSIICKRTSLTLNCFVVWISRLNWSTRCMPVLCVTGTVWMGFYCNAVSRIGRLSVFLCLWNLFGLDSWLSVCVNMRSWNVYSEWQYIGASAARRLCTLCWLEHEECHTWFWQAASSWEVQTAFEKFRNSVYYSEKLSHSVCST